MSALKELSKAKKKGIFYPSELATNFVNEYTPKKAVISINAFYNNMVVDYDEVKEIFKKISLKQKLIDNPTSSITNKKDTALTSYIANAIAYQEVKENEGAKAIWLASSSSNPSIDHLSNYDKIFYLGEGIDGEIPAERPNCQCGFSIIKNKEQK
jgi:hypothetical protein